ncbi:hypothetical protein LSUE1_G006831 [Lachnellula suecica]|uniref:AB hydrolase-1 domain-containing protein n=1 Tax=Lachnellula suecica TaxID=602035 RepID=A0A8T9C301_9HELO|nr:hypothetical protein LSUE1_G006831 [Lachnellula suecica]
MPSSKSTILIIQGSFQTSLVYSALQDGLKARGYPVVHPTLPSCNNTSTLDFPNITLIDDALVVRLKLIKLIEYEQRDVFVVLHSYGGLVGSEAIPVELTHSHRSSHGLLGGVTHLFFFAAFLIPAGQSVLSAFWESPNGDVRPDGRFDVRNGAHTLYSDLPEEEAKMCEEKMIPQSYEVQKTALTREAWTYVPSTYLVCENDQAVPASFQSTFAEMAKSTVLKCSAGHSPQLSETGMLVERIVEAAEKSISHGK